MQKHFTSKKVSKFIFTKIKFVTKIFAKTIFWLKTFCSQNIFLCKTKFGKKKFSFMKKFCQRKFFYHKATVTQAPWVTWFTRSLPCRTYMAIRNLQGIFRVSCIIRSKGCLYNFETIIINPKGPHK